MTRQRDKQQETFIPVYFLNDCIGSVDMYAMQRAMHTYQDEIRFYIELYRFSKAYGQVIATLFFGNPVIDHNTGWTRPVAGLSMGSPEDFERDELIQIVNNLPLILRNYSPGRVIRIQEPIKITTNRKWLYDL